MLLQDGIGNAKTDITIASLYIGTEGSPVTALVTALARAAANNGAERPQITILLDALRSTRPSKDASGAAIWCMDVQMCRPFLRDAFRLRRTIEPALKYWPSSNVEF